MLLYLYIGIIMLLNKLRQSTNTQNSLRLLLQCMSHEAASQLVWVWAVLIWAGLAHAAVVRLVVS